MTTRHVEIELRRIERAILTSFGAETLMLEQHRTRLENLLQEQARHELRRSEHYEA